MPHVGKRGRFLLFFGLLDAVYAFSLTAPDAQTRRAPLFLWLAEIAPLWVYAAAWGLVGALCVWQAFCRRDGLAFSAAILVKICWGVTCLGGWLFGDVDRGYVSTAIWLGLAYLIWVISSWPEPDAGMRSAWTSPSSSP